MKSTSAGPLATVDDAPGRVIENDKVVYFTSEGDEFSHEVAEWTANIEEFFGVKVRTK